MVGKGSVCICTYRSCNYICDLSIKFLWINFCGQVATPVISTYSTKVYMYSAKTYTCIVIQAFVSSVGIHCSKESTILFI